MHERPETSAGFQDYKFQTPCWACIEEQWNLHARLANTLHFISIIIKNIYNKQETV